MSSTNQTARIPVWDPVVRYGHWLLVVAFAVAWIAADDDGDPGLLHVWSGYAVGIVVLLRVFWGFAGSRHARFTDFVYRPADVVQYLKDLPRGRARRFLGHSPAGGAMTLALLACLAGTAGTGLMVYGASGKGPLAQDNQVVIAAAHASERREDHRAEPRREEGIMGDIHAALANMTLGLIVLHLGGVVLASVAHRENLVAAMITGRKRPGPG